MNNQTEITGPLADKSKKIADDISAVVSEAAVHVRDAGERNLQLAKDALVDTRAAIRRTQTRALDSSTGYVRKFPMRSVGMAAVAGGLVALFLSR